MRIHQGADVAGLIRKPGDRGGVAGVRLRVRSAGLETDRRREELAADLVVVADGRNSRLPDWLTALGYEPPQETVVTHTRAMPRASTDPPKGFKADWNALYIQQAPPADPRGGLVIPVEGGRWLVSLVGGDGDYPPTDEAGFLAFARSLRSPALYEAIAGAEPLTSIAGQRATENRLRHYDRLGRFPDGVVAVGDAACAFNPVYAQGMTAAALGSRSPGSLVAGGVVAPPSGSRSRLPASPGPGDRRRLAARRGRGLPLPDRGGAAAGSGRATDRLLHRRGDAGRHESAVGAATAGGGAPPAPPPGGAVRPRCPGPPGVGPARGGEAGACSRTVGPSGDGNKAVRGRRGDRRPASRSQVRRGQTTLIRTGR